jgi:hypothetical protein
VLPGWAPQLANGVQPSCVRSHVDAARPVLWQHNLLLQQLRRPRAANASLVRIVFVSIGSNANGHDSHVLHAVA